MYTALAGDWRGLGSRHQPSWPPKLLWPRQPETPKLLCPQGLAEMEAALLSEHPSDFRHCPCRGGRAMASAGTPSSGVTVGF